MGANFFITDPGAVGGRQLHIGKQSCGWQFHFHGIPERGLVTIGAWKEVVGESIIFTDDGRKFSWAEFAREVLTRKGSSQYDWYLNSPDGEIKDGGVEGVKGHIDAWQYIDKQHGFSFFFWKQKGSGHPFSTGDWS